MDRAALAWAALVVCPIGACSDASSARDPDVLVLAAASLTDVFQTLETAFEQERPGLDVEFSFAGSDALRFQIEQGAPADVVALADTEIMNALAAEGRVGPASVFATNSITIAVPPGNPTGVTGLADFARDELLLGACAPEVPCGAYAQRILVAAGVEPAFDTTDTDVRSLSAKISRGELDAGLVYVTDVLASAGSLDEVPLDGDADAGGAPIRAEYPIAVVDGADDAAREFTDFVLSTSGQRILAAAGFGPA
jgi:molybdate transport system substrate-binding protein